MRILVVDDVGYVRHYLDRLLTQHGHSVVTAASGTQALELLKLEDGIQVVITDLLMPGMDGLELFDAVRKIDRSSDQGTIPAPVFLLITALRPTPANGRREVNLLQQALDLGFADVFLKPIDNDHLLHQLAKLEQNQNQTGFRHAAPAPAPDDFGTLVRETEDLVARLAACDSRETVVQLLELLTTTVALLERRADELGIQPVENPASLEQIQQTLQTLQSLTDSVLSTENQHAVITMRRQLETQAEQLKQQLVGESQS